MKPFRTGAPSCTKCRALGADTFAPNGDLVCRGCAGAMEVNARLSGGKDTTNFGAAVGIVVGAMMLMGSGLVSAAGGMGGTNARFVYIFVGLGLLTIVSSYLSLKNRDGS